MRKLFGSASALALCGCATAPPSPPIGVSEDGLTSWLGIEYARAERWQLPEPGPDWNPMGSYAEMGPSCPQKNSQNTQEDCLFLNVFAADGATDQPVLIWFHGGGFVSNEGGDYVKSMVREGIVAVSFNYRLGQLGFYDWPGWSEDDPRNFGQADMVKALEWVQANIKRFGGNPDRVTLMGHSAGGMGVQLMMVDPRADGLFDRAIAHSGYAAWPFPNAYNPTDEERTRIRYGALPLEASPETLVSQIEHFHLPYTGGSDLSDQPLVLFRDGKSGMHPYLAGANSHDGLGTLQGAGFEPERFLSTYLDAPGVEAAYADDLSVSRNLAAERLFGDMRYVYSARETVRAHEGPTALFLLDAPGTGRNHVEHYEELFGPEPSDFRDLIVKFITEDGEAALEANGWQVFMPNGAVGAASGLDARLDVLTTLEFPKP